MAQFDFFGTWKDSWDVLEAIQQRRDVTFVPDLWYETPQPLLFRAVDESIKEMLRKRRRLYVWSNAFSRFPPALEQQTTGKMAGKYYVRLQLGGPGLELTLPACFDADGAVNLNSGSLSYAQATLNPKSGEWEEPSAELKAGYDDVRARLKRLLVRHRLSDWIWIGRDALELLGTGKARIVAKRVGVA